MINKIIKEKLRVLMDYCDRKKWNIGFFEYSDDFFYSDKKVNINVLKHNYKDKWFADPFILDVDKEKIQLLVEEFDEKINKGRIAKLIINRENFKLESFKVILEKKSHLSFPAILVDNNRNIFVYPENSNSGSLYKYKYNTVLENLDNPKLIIEEPLVDCVMISFKKNKYLFSTTTSDPHGNILNIYIKEKHKYKLFDTIKLTQKNARNAGDFIKLKDMLIRPSQDCNKSYGGGIIFQELSIKNEKISFKNIKRFYSNLYRYPLGLHTFNIKNDLAVVDVLGYKYFILGNIYNLLRKLYFNFKNK